MVGAGSAIAREQMASAEIVPPSPKASLLLKDVMAKRGEITDVDIKIQARDMSLDLNPAGPLSGNDWSVQLTPEQYSRLSKSKGTQSYQAEMTIQSVDSKGRKSTEHRPIEIEVAPPTG